MHGENEKRNDKHFANHFQKKILQMKTSQFHRKNSVKMTYSLLNIKLHRTCNCNLFSRNFFQVNFSFFIDENLRENKEVFFLRQFDEYFFKE